MSEKPPYIKYSSQVFGETAQNAILYVPKGSVSDYKNDNAWKIFKYIAEFEGASGIEVQQVNSLIKADVYSLNGTLIAKGLITFEKLPKGIYIINKKKYIKH